MEKGNKVEIINTGDIWEGKHGTVIAEEDGQVEVRVNFETQNGTEQVIEIFNKENLKMERQDESLNEQKEELDESLNYEKPEDIIHQYVYLQDLDDEEIPAWNFASRIATAENIEEGFVLKCAEDNGYKIFSVEAPSFFRTIIAAKEVKLEDIQEEYADFLQGNAVIYEMK